MKDPSSVRAGVKDPRVMNFSKKVSKQNVILSLSKTFSAYLFNQCPVQIAIREDFKTVKITKIRPQINILRPIMEFWIP